MEFFAKIVTGFLVLTIFVKSSTSDVYLVLISPLNFFQCINNVTKYSIEGMQNELKTNEDRLFIIKLLYESQSKAPNFASNIKHI